jgi:hypothetical protein
MKDNKDVNCVHVNCVNCCWMKSEIRIDERVSVNGDEDWQIVSTCCNPQRCDTKGTFKR